MPARIDGRRIAIYAGAAAVALAGVLGWLGSGHIRFMLAFESLGENAHGYAEYRHRQTGIVFVSLPGGTLPMGSTRAERENVIADVRERHGDYADKIAPGLHAREARAMKSR